MLDNPLATLRAGHPRLILTDERLAELKRRHESDPLLQKCLADVLAAADRMTEEPPVEYRLIGPRLLRVSRRMVQRMYALGLAYRWTGERKYLDAAAANLDAACAFKDWHPSHFLDTAEMTHAVAIGYDWLHDDLGAERRSRVRRAILDKGLNVGLAVYEGTTSGWWPRVTHNWNQVCNGGLAVGALAVADTDAEVAGAVLRHAVTNLPLALAEYGPDGAWGEGPGYWGYATRYTVYALAAMDTALGTDFGLSDTPGLGKAGEFPLYCSGPTRLYFNYADSGERNRYRTLPSLLWLGRRYDRPLFIHEELESIKATRAEARHVIWYPDAEVGQQAERELDKYFRGHVEVVVMRSAWDDPDAIWVAVKAGDNQVNHGHLDLGNFELDALGVRWARDLGSDDYNLPGYWDRRPGGQRWNYFRMNTASHSVPMLNGEHQCALAKARLTAFRTAPTEGRAVIDLTEAYTEAAARVTRGVGLVANRNAVLVQDEFEITGSADVAWGMTTDAEIDVRGGEAMLTLEGKRLGARILHPAGAAFTVESAEKEPPQKINEGVRRLMIRLPKQSGALRIAVLLAPPADIDAAADKVQLQPLDRW